MKISAKIEYACIAMMELASTYGSGEPVRIRRIAEQHGILAHPRHEVRPGMTGPWQVSANRPGYVHENVHLDAQYVQDLTFIADTKIILRTVVVLSRASGQ